MPHVNTVVKNDTLTVDAILEAAKALQEQVDEIGRAFFSAFPDANYERGDVLFLHESYKELIPSCLASRVKTSAYVEADRVIVSVGFARRGRLL